MDTHRKIKMCIISGIPTVLSFFYADLIKSILDREIHLHLVSSMNEKLLSLVSSVKCDYYLVNITRNITPVKDVLAGIKIFLYFSRNKFDILHAHSPKGGLIGMLAAYLARIPCRVYTIHGLPLETASGIGRKLLWASEKLSCSLSTHILAVSQSLKEKVIAEKLCSSDKISVLENGTACGIDIKRFTPNQKTSEQRSYIRHKFGIPENACVIGFMGRLTPEKGIHTLVRSFLKMATTLEYIYLLLVGDFDETREKFDMEILGLIKSNHNIISVGFQSDPVPFYAAMDIFVMPTRREGFGMTFLEANAMNLPVIGTRVTGCVDAISDGNTGLLVNLDNENELTEAISRLVVDKELRAKLSSNGKKRVEKYFCSEKLVNAHLELYDRLLSETKNPS